MDTLIGNLKAAINNSKINENNKTKLITSLSSENYRPDVMRIVSAEIFIHRSNNTTPNYDLHEDLKYDTCEKKFLKDCISIIKKLK